MKDLIGRLEEQHELEATDVRRLHTEHELILLRIDYCRHRYRLEGRDLYELLVYYGGLERWTAYLQEPEKESLRKDIRQYNERIIAGSFDETDRSILAQILFMHSDHVKGICDKRRPERCFGYDVWEKKGAALHFTNAVMPEHPLKGKELDHRKEELHEIALDIRTNHPSIEFIFSVSWMWHLEAFKSLMPDPFIESLQEFTEHDCYSLGHWGQFYRHDGGVNEERIRQFRETWEFPFSVLLGECPIKDFFETHS